VSDPKSMSHSNSPPNESGRTAPWKQRAVSAEINGRRVNEAIERGSGYSEMAVFVCECGYVDCSTTIALPIDDYEAVRTDFDRFLLTPGHEIAEVDTVVERNPSYLVVVKLGPEAKARSRATDPRSG
jgi:hypothetical protein